ncbi:hypothetical protein [Enterovirga sp. CN4-39]|uniref:hypothetical protein n=1 Tax=Enterovirga sp. CN4-39 TaxID=3400910 RepID=UPI003C0509AF
MPFLHTSISRHGAIRAEMRELRVGKAVPYPAAFLGLLAASCTASAIMTLFAA